MTLLMCIAIGISPGACSAETQFDMPITESAPTWATEEWQEFASHIVQGEIPPGCEKCAQWVACTMVRDVDRGWNPFGLRKRWYGWKTPTPMARRAVSNALEPYGCYDTPDCKFLGNTNDYQCFWKPMPKVETGNRNGDVVCVLGEKGWAYGETEQKNTTAKRAGESSTGTGRGASNVVR